MLDIRAAACAARTWHAVPPRCRHHAVQEPWPRQRTSPSRRLEGPPPLSRCFPCDSSIARPKRGGRSYRNAKPGRLRTVSYVLRRCYGVGAKRLSWRDPKRIYATANLAAPASHRQGSTPPTCAVPTPAISLLDL